MLPITRITCSNTLASHRTRYLYLGDTEPLYQRESAIYRDIPFIGTKY